MFIITLITVVVACSFAKVAINILKEGDNIIGAWGWIIATILATLLGAAIYVLKDSEPCTEKPTK